MNKLSKLLSMVIILGTVFTSASAQRQCSMEQYMQDLLSDPEFVVQYDKRQLKFEAVESEAQSKLALCPNPVVLPVAVHFQGIGSPNQACLVALAQGQIDIINNDFQGTNTEIASDWNSGVSSFFPGVSNGETCVEFCLATSSHPTGYGLTEGQPAVTINATSGDFDSNWSGYINVWVRNIGALGYSPLGGNGNGDGVTIDVNAFGAGAGCSGVSPGFPFDLGRTLTHELGHFFNLGHIWGGGCGADDGVGDTPDSSGPYSGCPENPSASCGTNDMHMSYMDYSDDRCMYMFSAGQSTRMENWISANLGNVASNASTTCSPPAPHCSNGIQDADETGVDCGGADCAPCPCPSTTIYLPDAIGGGPALIICDTDPAPSGYSPAGSQSCAQNVIDTDPFCLDNDWDQICQDAYDTCVGSSPTCDDGIQNGNETGVDCGGPDCPPCPCNSTTIYIPDVVNDGPALIICDGDPVPPGYSAAADQNCAQTVIDADPFCLETSWDGVCQDAYDTCTGSGACEAFNTAPVDLTKSFDPVNGIQDRVQVKWFKASPQIKYSDEDAAMCDIKFWPKRNLIPGTTTPTGPVIVAGFNDTIYIVDAKKTYPDTSPREIFKWPVKFRKNSDNPSAKRADPNIRYEWQVRCECGHDGNGPESPWSDVKIFNTPDFDPETGIYNPPGGIESGESKISHNSDIILMPNPASESIRLWNSNGLPESFDWYIIDMTGRILRSGAIKSNKSDMIHLDVIDIAQGSYQILLVGGEFNNSIPFIIRR